jgi:spore maturation protein B
METLRSVIGILSYFVLPLILVGFPLYGLYKRVPVYESFVEGAKEGFRWPSGSSPTSSRSSSRSGCSGPPARWTSSSPRSTRSSHSSGSRGGAPDGDHPPAHRLRLGRLVVDLINQFGEDHLFVKMAATMFGSTETTFYVIAVYFGAVNIKKTRHAVPAGLIADFTAMLVAVWVVRLLFA